MPRQHAVFLHLLTHLLVFMMVLPGLAAAASHTSPAKTTTNSIGMEFVLIPAGTFQMGSTDGDRDEKPVHQATISRAFYMGKYEVTQAQWEAIYSFGPDASQLPQHGWSKENSGGQTHPVGQLKSNAWGLYDMHGNVWEWVQDWYHRYASEAVTDPTGPKTGTRRSRRGCAWNNLAPICRTANRYSVTGYRDDFLGFRLVQTLP